MITKSKIKTEARRQARLALFNAMNKANVKTSWVEVREVKECIDLMTSSSTEHIVSAFITLTREARNANRKRAQRS